MKEMSHNPEDGFEKRKVPRLSVGGELFKIYPPISATPKTFSVLDLSPQGMALRVIDEADLALFPVGMKIEGVVNIKGQKLPVSTQVKNLRKDVVGFEFLILDPKIRETLESFLTPERLGKDLKPMPTGGSSLWYHGSSGTDLLVKRGADGSFVVFTLFVQGFYVQWSETEGLATGKTEHEDAPFLGMNEHEGVIRLETMCIKKDEKPDPDKLKVAKSIILSSNLPEDFKSKYLRKL